MTLSQQIITISICIGGTMLTRFLPFILFNEKRKTPAFIQYIGKYLPSAVFGDYFTSGAPELSFA